MSNKILCRKAKKASKDCFFYHQGLTLVYGWHGRNTKYKRLVVRYYLRNVFYITARRVDSKPKPASRKVDKVQEQPAKPLTLMERIKDCWSGIKKAFNDWRTIF